MKREIKKSTVHTPKTDEFDRVNLGLRLREQRKYLHLSQNVVAEYVGIPRTALSQIESGHRKIDAFELKKLAELYKYPVSYFTGETSTAAETDENIAYLARLAEKLSEHDREELSRFADYLHVRAQTLRSKDD